MSRGRATLSTKQDAVFCGGANGAGGRPDAPDGPTGNGKATPVGGRPAASIVRVISARVVANDSVTPTGRGPGPKTSPATRVGTTVALSRPDVTGRPVAATSLTTRPGPRLRGRPPGEGTSSPCVGTPNAGRVVVSDEACTRPSPTGPTTDVTSVPIGGPVSASGEGVSRKTSGAATFVAGRAGVGRAGPGTSLCARVAAGEAAPSSTGGVPSGRPVRHACAGPAKGPKAASVAAMPTTKEASNKKEGTQVLPQVDAAPEVAVCSVWPVSEKVFRPLA